MIFLYFLFNYFNGNKIYLFKLKQYNLLLIFYNNAFYFTNYLNFGFFINFIIYLVKIL